MRDDFEKFGKSDESPMSGLKIYPPILTGRMSE